MKICNKFLPLLLVSPVFSMYDIRSPINDFILGNSPNYLMKRVEPTPEYEAAYIKCGEALVHNYKDCVKNVDDKYIENMDVNCNNFKTDKCQEFYEKGLGIMPECQGDMLKEDRKVDQMLIDTLIAQYRYICSKDETGDYCPHNTIISDTLRNDTDSTLPQIYEKKLYEAINNTCRSTICTEEYLKLNKNLDEYEKKYEEYKEGNKKIKETKGKIDPAKVKKDKRGFQIENFTHVDKNTIREKSIEFLTSNECKQIAKDAEKEKFNSKANPSFALKFNSFILVLFSLIIFTIV